VQVLWTLQPVATARYAKTRRATDQEPELLYELGVLTLRIVSTSALCSIYLLVTLTSGKVLVLRLVRCDDSAPHVRIPYRYNKYRHLETPVPVEYYVLQRNQPIVRRTIERSKITRESGAKQQRQTQNVKQSTEQAAAATVTQSK
jgi:hypothetical protein